MNTSNYCSYCGISNVVDNTPINMYVNDRSAYIFSLVNKYGQPIIMKAKDGCEAVCKNSSAGPIFGNNNQNDIYICDNSNTCNTSYSYVGNSYQLRKVYFSTGESLAESKNFQVQEIEVYQLIKHNV